MTHVRELTLCQLYLKDSDWLPMPRPFKMNTTLPKLESINVGIGDEMMQHIAMAFVHNRTLSDLTVESNPDITMDGIDPFHENPESMKHLETFLFAHSLSDSTSFTKVKTAISVNHRRFRLHRRKFGGIDNASGYWKCLAPRTL